MPKVSLRDRLLADRQSLSLEECRELSLRAQQRILETPEFAAAKCIALYSAIRNEVLTDELFAGARRAAKRVVYPRMRDEHLEFLPVASLGELSPGALGVLEPVSGEEVALREIDLMVVPGVGFDHQGHRLGYGRGFYDRVLEEEAYRPFLVGLGFEQQVVERLPRDPHDVQLDMLVTDTQVRRSLKAG